MQMLSREEFQRQIGELKKLAARAGDEAEVREVTSKIASITRQFRIQSGIGLPTTPLAQALELKADYRIRPHLQFLSDRISNAVRDVERGQDRMMMISMPPRSGKTRLVSQLTPLWLLRRHPEWEIVLTSFDGELSGGWARDLRRQIESNPGLGVALERDGGKGSSWRTLEGGGMYSTSLPGGSLIRRGARVLIIDDPVKDFVDAHSKKNRDRIWNWWLSTSHSRLETPFLVLVVMTRWHEDDFVGRLLSNDYPGNPKHWEKIILPAFAGEDDPIGRSPGEPLISPLRDETKNEATARWEGISQSVGTYTFSAMYQQRPAPAKGAIFDSGWWKFWTIDPSRETEDGRTVYLDPGLLTNGKWIDSWDCAFDSSKEGSSGWVVGQRWVRNQANRYLVDQRRGRWSFTETLEQMRIWAQDDDPRRSPYGHLVHRRLIEKKANGAAIINTLQEEISGMVPINPTDSKEARARAITPEIESGNVYLPHPGDPGNEWVNDLLSELRNFPHDVADDQVDTLTQALADLRTSGRGRVTMPQGLVSRNYSPAAKISQRRIAR